AWAAAMGLLTLEGGLATYLFMYPRFKEGEFGGKFTLGPASVLPPVDASPEAETSGKFWLVNTDAGPKAIYMVCTHLGCLYKWEPSNNRFECPCHGSKFSREGFYIEGPAPRSLDQFIVEVDDNGVVATTTESDQGAIPPEVPSPSAEIRVNTGKRILGRPSAESPAKDNG
ncbi:MAG: Rieske 2Fe-2S domain-containing protein, partial [Caldilineaceae bacterium]